MAHRNRYFTELNSMVIFHGYVTNNQMVPLGFTIGQFLLGFSCGLKNDFLKNVTLDWYSDIPIFMNLHGIE
jgi:hypothetical protein